MSYANDTTSALLFLDRNEGTPAIVIISDHIITRAVQIRQPIFPLRHEARPKASR